MRYLVIIIIVFSTHFSIQAQTVGGAVSPDTTVCNYTNTGILTLSGETGSIIRWQYSDNNGITWKNIGSTSGKSTYAFAGLSKTTWYRAEVELSPSPPNVTEFSSHAVVTVDEASSGAVSSDQSVCSGSNSGVLTIAGDFTSVNYWEYSVDGGSTYSVIANTSSSENFNNLTQTTLYRANVTNGVCPAADVTPAIVTVDPVSVGGVVSGATTVCSGSNSGTVTLGGYMGTIVRWQYSTNNGSSWTNISNSNSFHNYSNLSTPTEFRAEISSGTCPSANSTPVMIQVDDAASGSVSGSTTVCSGSNGGTLALSGVYQTVNHWEYSIDGGATYSVVVNDSSSHAYSNLTQTTLFRADITNGVCPATKSSDAMITVSPVSVGGTVSGGIGVCAGSNSGTLNLSGHTGSVIRWQSSTNDGNTWSNIANTTTFNNYTNVTSTTWYRAVVESGACPADNSIHDTLEVSPASNGGTVYGSTVVCDSSTTGTLNLSGETGNVLFWQHSIDSGLTWDTIINSTNSNVFTGITKETFYRAVVKSGACVEESSNPAIISLAPKANAGFSTTVTGSTLLTTNTSASSGGTYLWNFGDSSATSSVTSPAHTYTANGTYVVILIVSDSCGTDTATQTIVVQGLGISDWNSISNLSLYPNPANESVNVKFSTDQEQDLELQILDLRGQQLFSKTLPTRLHHHDHTIDLERISPGLYFMRINSSTGSITRKLLVK